MRKIASAGLWKYLDELGVLEKGSNEEIKAAKKQYRLKYFIEYRKQYRKKKPEYSVYYSRESGEHNRIIQAARKHNLSPTSFIRLSSLAYIDNKYIVPNQEQVAHLEQLLADCLNEVKTLVSRKERFFWDREEKINAIEKLIQKLEAQIDDVFRNPPLAINYDRKNKIA
jgi:hypothetical protein